MISKELAAMAERMDALGRRIEALEQVNRDRLEAAPPLHEMSIGYTEPEGDISPRPRELGVSECPQCGHFVPGRMADHMPLCPCRSVS